MQTAATTKKQLWPWRIERADRPNESTLIAAKPTATAVMVCARPSLGVVCRSAATPSQPAEIPVDHHAVEVARKAAERVVGYEAPLRGGWGSNDSSYLIHDAGVPTICGFGPGDQALGNAHGADEKVRVQELVDFAKIYALMIAGICGGASVSGA